MTCPHLEQLFMDIKQQGIKETSPERVEAEDRHETIYVDCYLDRKSIRQKHNFPDFVTDYIFPEIETQPREGLVCNQCNHAIIGLHKGFMPGCQTFGYNESGQAHLFYFEDSHAEANILDTEDQEKPLKEKTKQRGHGSFIFAILLGIPIALFRYLPQYPMLEFVAGICTLMIVPLILSPITQKIRGKDRFSFPFVSIFLSLLMGALLFILFGWTYIYYFLAVYAALLFFGSIVLRIRKECA